MPRFRPFAGLRYDRSVPLAKVIAPPYDVVGPDERAIVYRGGETIEWRVVN